MTTASVWVCSYCGALSHLDGTVAPQSVALAICPARPPQPEHVLMPYHVLKPVLVVVPYA